MQKILKNFFRLALAIAVELRDQATEAQACYSLGNTCTLLGEHGQGKWIFLKKCFRANLFLIKGGSLPFFKNNIGKFSVLFVDESLGIRLFFTAVNKGLGLRPGRGLSFVLGNLFLA